MGTEVLPRVPMSRAVTERVYLDHRSRSLSNKTLALKVAISLPFSKEGDLVLVPPSSKWI